MKKLILRIVKSLLLILLFAGAPDVIGQNATLVAQTSHSGFVFSLSFSPTGKTIATGSLDQTIRLWDVGSGRLVKVLSGHSAAVTSVSFSPDGMRIATGSQDSTIKIWDIASGHEIRTLRGHDWIVNAVQFSPDGERLASASSDKLARIWNFKKGVEVIVLSGHSGVVRSAVFSPDGTMVATGSLDKTIKIWDANSGENLRTLVGHDAGITSVRFSPDGKTIVSGSEDKTVRQWDVASGSQIRILAVHSSIVSEVAFSPDGRLLASDGGDKTLSVWDTKSGQAIKTISGLPSIVGGLEFSPDGNVLGVALANDTSKLIQLDDWSENSLSGESDYAHTVIFSPSGESLAAGFEEGGIRTWDLNQGGIRSFSKQIGSTKSIGYFSDESSLSSFSDYDLTRWETNTGKPLKAWTHSYSDLEAGAFSPDGKTIAGVASGHEILLWSFEKEAYSTVFAGHKGSLNFVRSISFSPDGRLLASGSSDKTVKIWDIATGNELRTLVGHSEGINSVSFSSDNRVLASGGKDGSVRLWGVSTGMLLKILAEFSSRVEAVKFSPVGKVLAGGLSDGSIRVWDTEKGTELFRLIGHTAAITSLSISNDGNMLASASRDRTVRLWDLGTGKEICSLLSIGESDWAVTTPDGLFDASPGARDQLHYVVGLEPVTLEQMKGVYYVPGLLGKVLRGEALPKVELFTSKDLFPEAEFSFREEEKVLEIRLRDRGGGIGAVQVLVNGKEFISDARPEDFDPNSKEAKLTVSLEGAPFKTRAGEENRIEVVARNREGSLTSRGTPKGSETVKVAGAGGKLESPDIYAIVGGVSDYTGDGLDLRFAAKDAEDFAKAIELGAVRLTGDAKKVHIRLLTSSGGTPEGGFTVPDSKVTTARKEDFREAFEEFSGAKPDDIFIVYLSGHGTSVNLNSDPMRAGGDLYLYMTQEATSTSRDVLVVKTSREAMTLSSEELRELMKKNRALKQILVLDTCAAGAAVESFVGKRDLPSDQIKALEILKDNMGFYVLMGSAADRVSYEASRYGQGLLTYSLLQGMKGAKLRDGGYAFVGELFSYAREMVPQMAVNIGGVQEPLVIVPDASGNFPFGRFTQEDQQQIRLSSPKPQILRPSLQNERLRFDNLKLEQMLTQKLREMSYVSARGKNEAPLVFIDALEMPDAMRPSGSYTVENGVLTITLVLVKGNETVGEEILAQGPMRDLEKVINTLTLKIIEKIR